MKMGEEFNVPCVGVMITSEIIKSSILNSCIRAKEQIDNLKKEEDKEEQK